MRLLTSFQNIHSEDKVVVCGCGTSLNAFLRPERFVTIGVNDVGRLFQPKYLLVVDPKERFKADRFHYVETSQAEYLFTQLDLGVSHPNIVKFRLGRKDGTDFSDPNALHYGVVTPYMALYLASYMGAKCIGLIGVDFTDHHFFGDTGAHAWTPYVSDIDAQFHRLGAALLTCGVKVFNLSQASRLTAFPKVSLEEFASIPLPFPRQDALVQTPLRIVSYATTPVVGVPSILSRCINARTPHSSRCLWATGDYGNGMAYEGDIDWKQSVATERELKLADVIVLHNGKVGDKHRPLLAGKTVITMAHNYIGNVDTSFVQQDSPGVVVSQYPATLPEYRGWRAVPNPVPSWEPAFQPDVKDDVVTICYTPAGKHEQYPRAHPLYWHSKGYTTTMSILDRLATRFPLRLEVIRDRQVPHTESLAMKRRAHIVIDECVTGSYHRNSLEGLAAGCVVVNGVGLLAGVSEAVQQSTGSDVPAPFTFASLETLEGVLVALIERGAEDLAAEGARNRVWMEQHWDFATQWERCWQPVIDQERSTQVAKRHAASSRPQFQDLSVVVVSLNEGEYLRRTIDNLLASLPDGGEIIVVDDGSTDGSAEFLKSGYEHVRIVRAAERLGAARARNFGARHARGKILAFCDAHVAAPSGWAAPLLVALENPDVGAVMPAIRVMRYPDDYVSMNGSKEARGYGLRWRDAALSVGWLGAKGKEPYAVPLLGAAFLAMRRNLFAALGGFDSGLLIWGCDDAELSVRLWTLGYECFVVPGVEVAHRFRSERPYRVEWETVVYNKLRLAAMHFGAERRARVTARLQQSNGFPQAMKRLDASDVAARREQLQSLRRHDDDWFFEKFREEIALDLAANS